MPVGEAKIHLVDDEATLRTVLRAVLSEAGYDVEVSDSGEQALQALQRRACDVLLVDKNLPGINGIDLSLRAREHSYARHCVMITGYPSLGSLVDAIHAGIEGYLTKPFERVGDAVKIVAEVLDRRPRSTQIQPRQLRQHLLRSAAGHEPSCVAVLAERRHRDLWLRRLPQAQVFARTELGLGALSGKSPDLVAADDVAVLGQLVARAELACACFMGTLAGFDQGLELMRMGGAIVVEPAELVAGSAG